MSSTLAIDLVSEQVTGPYLGALVFLAIPLAFGLFMAVMSATPLGRFLSGFVGGAGTAVAFRWFGRISFTVAALFSMGLTIDDPGAMGYLGAVLWQFAGLAVVLFCNMFRLGVRLTILGTDNPLRAAGFGAAFTAAAFIGPLVEWQLSLFVLFIGKW